jgi:hypothetical protein
MKKRKNPSFDYAATVEGREALVRSGATFFLVQAIIHSIRPGKRLVVTIEDEPKEKKEGGA